MKRTSVKRLSILGLVLIGVSAVTAAIIPNNANASFHGDDNGTLRDATSEGQTCVTNDNGGAPVCTKTQFSSLITTAAVANFESTVNGNQTLGNTSDTAGQIGDQDSDTQPL